MIISLVRESRIGEKRVLLLPRQVKSLTAICDFYVEKDSGIQLGIKDAEYEKAGGRIVNKRTAWGKADFVLKLKRPTINELTLMKDQTRIAALFHAEVKPELIDMLLKKNITSYSFEYFKDENGAFPLMKATGEISGKQAIIYAAYHLQSHIAGSGKMICPCSTMEGARIAILGFGNVGKAAAEIALALGAKLVIFRWGKKAETIVKINDIEVHCLPWKKKLVDEIIPTCDVVIGAIRISTFDTPVFLSSSVLNKMKKGSVVIDVTAGYGRGFIESSNKTTTLSEPFYIMNGIKYIKIRELPLGVHRTSAEQISQIYAPHLYRLIDSIYKGNKYPIAENGVITRNGILVNKQVKMHYNLRFKE